MRDDLAGEKLLREEEIGKGQPLDRGRGNGEPEARQKKLLIGNSKRSLTRESKLHNYQESARSSVSVMQSMKDVLVPDSKNELEHMSEWDKKREQVVEMTTHQVTLDAIAKRNFHKKTNLLNDFTYVGF